MLSSVGCLCVQVKMERNADHVEVMECIMVQLGAIRTAQDAQAARLAEIEERQQRYYRRFS